MTLLLSPVYHIPLSEAQLVLIGRITVVWAQVDFHLDRILMSLHNIDEEQCKTFYGRTTIGPKSDAAKIACSRARSELSRSSIAEMCADIGLCLRDRNLMTHGMWGYIWDADIDDWVPGAVSINKREYLPAAELSDLHEKVIRAALSADLAFYRQVHGQEPPPGYNRSFASSPFPPEDSSVGPPPIWNS